MVIDVAVATGASRCQLALLMDLDERNPPAEILCAVDGVSELSHEGGAKDETLLHLEPLWKSQPSIGVFTLSNYFFSFLLSELTIDVGD